MNNFYSFDKKLEQIFTNWILFLGRIDRDGRLAVEDAIVSINGYPLKETSFNKGKNMNEITLYSRRKILSQLLIKNATLVISWEMKWFHNPQLSRYLFLSWILWFFSIQFSEKNSETVKTRFLKPSYEQNHEKN